MGKKAVDYETKKVALTRLYPFGTKAKAKVRGVEKEVTVVEVQELTGVDDEALLRNGKEQTIYSEIAMACGLTTDEAKSLTRADANLINTVMQDFLFDSTEVVLID